MGTDKRARQKANRNLRLEEAIAEQERRQRQQRVAGVVLVVVLVVAGLVVLLRSAGSSDETAGGTTTTTVPFEPKFAGQQVPPGPGESITGPTPCPAADGSSPRTTSFSEAPPMCIDTAKRYLWAIDTTAGWLVFELDTKAMPQAVNNFVVLTRYHYYDQTDFFRIAPSIGVVQGGAPLTNFNDDPGPGYTIPDEAPNGQGEFDFSVQPPTGPFTYQAGDLVMARTSAPNSTGAQFFIAYDGNVANLDSNGIYLKIGKAIDYLDTLGSLPRTYAPYPDQALASLGGGPTEPLILQEARIIEE